MTARSLADWLAYLEQLHPTAIDMGLDRVRAVVGRLGLTRPAPLVITVTGTNGKGSTCAFIAALLSSRGYKVGSYSSPHLLRYNERVQFDGREASDDQLCQAFSAVEAARGEVSLTYFEMGTLAAFWLFERSGLDAVVLEVGLGGRLDAVNVIDADLAVITNIGLDHADWLGDTRDSVAYEKAGIMRDGIPALCGDLDVPMPLLEHAESLKSPLLLRGRDFDLALDPHAWHWRGVGPGGEPLELHDLPLLSLPMENAALALQAYATLGLPWEPAALTAALQRTRVVGRLDRRQVCWRDREIALLLDVGHNPHAASYLAQRLEQRSVDGRRLAVFGLLADKDLNGVLEAMSSSIADWAVAPLPTPRTQSATQLAAALLERGASVSQYASFEQALDAQCAKAEAGDEVVVFGSFYCVAAALDWLEQRAGDSWNGDAG
ncbi:bifunctional tetrahydrofolate synthase/dihydrofolate synthase [Pseudomonas stutzeri]|jgi:dihydrofolate synthase/folylpolyglutamate synthase|uniref:Dihydrofolate synthase/folylpolyglutamate synthase n=1 Tax=Stutzerimonas stutzeri NF13 TaxID=1212548 RepID=M2VJ43_STUST|nr:bifunctional tetrahydrofolate synthase/dihydrofolate synthase [Stutzerimonas stutzeri]EMD99678.1 folylpolyglutamate synthetase [Stutzerimonas stutzeri NF13]MBK3883232.1 bifunctional tetrahydrofolate synthase/dihydrofolate synthase [Stutzerimonas stutzeri]MBS68980.1 bifunctional tetrahydrofolate synthase/dihydrofolate synthase [Pseudomonas sp.]